MLISNDLIGEPGSDAWWMNRLGTIMSARTPHVYRMLEWYFGNAPMPDLDAMVDDKTAAVYKRLVRLSRMNLASLLVDARLPRMRLSGARTTADDSPNGDDVVAELLREQNLNVKLRLAWRDALVTGKGYIVSTVGGMMHSSPLNTVCVTDSFGNVAAAMTAYVDEMTQENVLLLARPGYVREARSSTGMCVLPNAIYEAKTGGEFKPGMFAKEDATAWSMLADRWDLGEPSPTGTEGVPVYEFAYDRGLLKKHEASMLRINQILLQRSVIFATQAFKQQIILDAPLTDADGNPIDYSKVQLDNAPGSLWFLPQGAKFWESSTADTSPMQEALQDELRNLAGESRTPLFMLSSDSVNASSEGASAQRELLAFDIEELEDLFTETLKRLISDALIARGETERADRAQMRIEWVDPRRPSQLERATAIAAATGAGIPLDTALRKFGGFTPDEVEETMREVGVGKLIDTLSSNVAPLENPYPAVSPGQEEAPASGTEVVDTAVNFSPDANRISKTGA